MEPDGALAAALPRRAALTGALRGRLAHPSASARALLGTTIGSLPGFLLPFALGWRLGAGRLTDAYFLSFAVATFTAGVLSNVLEVGVIPAVAEHARSGAHAVRVLLARTMTASIGVAVLAYAPTALIGVWIVAGRHGWSAAEKHLAILLILVFGGYILASALTGVLDGAMYARGRYLVPTASQCMRTLLPLAFILLTPRSAQGVLLTASLLVVGELLRAVLLGTLLVRELATLRGEGDGAAPPRSRLLEASLPLAMSLVVVAASPVIDKLVASPLGTGSVTLIELAEKVFFVPVLALSSSVVLVAGSRWAAMRLEHPERLRAEFARTLRIVLVLSTLAALTVGAVVTLATVIAGPRILGMDSARFRELVLLFLLGLPGAIVIAQGARLMTSLQRTRLLPLFALSAFAVNLLADIAGAKLMGVDGIALASTLFRCVNAALYVWTCALLLRTLAAPRSRPIPFLLR